MAISPYVPRNPGRTLVNSGWNARVPKPVKTTYGGGLGFVQKQGSYLTDPGLWDKGGGFSGQPGAIPSMEDRYGPGGLNMGYTPPGGGGRWVQPDYSGILGSFTADARARFGAGLQAMEAQRLSGAKGAINRLGVRDVAGMLDKVKQYGLSQADLQGAFDNPWSELKALDMQKRGAWNNSVAGLATQGGFRSGASIGARGRIDQDAARNEALLTQNTLEELSQGMFQKSEWERQQRDQMEQAIAQQQAQLAAAYQPYWQQD